MCEECGETPVQFVAYFNKPGGKHWRPPQLAATSSPSPLLRGEGRGEGALRPAHARGEAPSLPSPASGGGGAFVCEETRAE
jgi:hypothetical protein